MIFPASAIPDIYAGKITAILVPLHYKVKAGQVRSLRREVVVHDEEGTAVGRRVEYVRRAARGSDDPTTMKLTIESVEQTAPIRLTQQEARRCGMKTAWDARARWEREHPRSPLCQIVSFHLGDTTDRPLYLQWTGRAGGDYTRNPGRSIEAVEVVPPDVVDEMAKHGRVAADYARRYELEVKRGEIVKHLNELAALADHDDEVEASVRRLNRELAILGEKIAV